MKHMDEGFWKAIDQMIEEAELVIDRPKGSTHPQYQDIIYEVAYGYLEGTASMDGGGIDVWKGTKEGLGADAVMCTIDLVKKDSEIKILIDCSEEEKEIVYQFHNRTPFMKGILMRRDQ